MSVGDPRIATDVETSAETVQMRTAAVERPEDGLLPHAGGEGLQRQRTGREAYSLFCGPIDHHVVTRVFRAGAEMLDARVSRLHLLLQSNGGSVGEGVCLFNYLRSLPFEVRAYNAGAIHSIGAVAYLGAHRRVASRYSVFMVHRCRLAVAPAPVSRLRALTHDIQREDARVEALLRQELRLDERHWARLKYHDLVLSAEEAVEVGLAHAIGDFSVPPGAVFYPLV